MIKDGTISGKIAKDLFEIIWEEGGDPAEVVEKRGMKQVTDTGAIEKAVDEVIAANPDQVAKAQAKPALAGWFVGQVMKAVMGCAHRRQGQPAMRRTVRRMLRAGRRGSGASGNWKRKDRRV
jgi:aspartyl-tRNA(Asn)/glutamyl-tRNA(Gln) amidotransferase subunit B